MQVAQNALPAFFSVPGLDLETISALLRGIYINFEKSSHS
jgi:hypothetical protein